MPLRAPAAIFDSHSDATNNLLKELEKLSENHSKRASNYNPPSEIRRPENEPLDPNINVRNS